MRNFFGVDFFVFSELGKFHFPKYKDFFWENIRNLFKVDFFCFSSLGWKVAQISLSATDKIISNTI